MKSATVQYEFSESEAAVLKFLCETYRLGSVPSVRDICEEFGWSSPNAAHRHLKALEAMKLVKRRGPGRSLQIMPRALKIYG